MASELFANVFVVPPVSMKRPDGGHAGTWPPIAYTLTYGPNPHTCQRFIHNRRHVNLNGLDFCNNRLEGTCCRLHLSWTW
ncbi:uncharacterized protein A1O9_08534 [Exophiala aquamarina CBS 119918]|uniref:Uncharacterized protein n=1 Tax=Exophiala aquamarina CBS 119918 TaxID=1182545 RepID=A0A072P957_9EURO|nr:uncharacterized protein A1O9_08534 [Exophiala aquamarina CBS 119918]KEF55783.1 hypothetical protein A1O9_08534 [Exophiala aquamarina CBS 119918]